MHSQHAEGSSLVRWLQKDPFSGRKTEVVVERVMCDCLDRKQQPCWVVLEKSPDIKNFEQFSGKWESFDIAPCPKGHLRAIIEDSGRVFEPISQDACRISM